jgi:hypothetical protein
MVRLMRRGKGKKAKAAAAAAAPGGDGGRLLAGLPPEQRQAVLDAARSMSGLRLSEGAFRTTLTTEKAPQGRDRAPRAAAVRGSGVESASAKGAKRS